MLVKPTCVPVNLVKVKYVLDIKQLCISQSNKVPSFFFI